MMTALILSPTGATFETRSANPCETRHDADCADQNPNTGVKRLMIALDDAEPNDGPRRIAILFFGDIEHAELSTSAVPRLSSLT